MVLEYDNTTHTFLSVSNKKNVKYLPAYMVFKKEKKPFSKIFFDDSSWTTWS